MTEPEETLVANTQNENEQRISLRSFSLMDFMRTSVLSPYAHSYHF